MRTVHAGWRFFFCEECGAHFIEACRDHETPSHSECVNDECQVNIQGGLMPYQSVSDAHLEVDGSGNLINPQTYVFKRGKA